MSASFAMVAWQAQIPNGRRLRPAERSDGAVERDPWTRYEAWNNALAARWFSGERANEPVYLDVDQQMLDEVAVRLGEASDGASALGEAVAESIREPGVAFLVRHKSALESWRRELRAAARSRELLKNAPPVMALLASFTVAAYQMGMDGSYVAYAYHPRLQDYLRIPSADREAFRSAFVKQSEDFWRALNEYLGHHEGRLGLPTAYSLGHRYVGIPQSQALLRATDRVRLPGFFRAFGLPAGAEVVPSDLEHLLDHWVRQVPSPVSANFVRLWKGRARGRIAQVVALELSHWDGSYRQSEVAEAETAGDLNLTALIRRRLGGEQLELSFAVRFATPIDADVLTVASADGGPTIAVITAPGGRMRPEPGSRIDPVSLLGSRVEIEEAATAQAAVRLPRRVVPLHQDELLGVFVETERVLLAEDAVVLVKDEPALVAAVTELVEAHGRYERVFATDERSGCTRLSGLPEGWVLFSGVQLFRVPPADGKVELNALIPLSTARLVLSGGLKLPGRVRKWSSLCPPEIRAVAADPDADVSATLSRLGDDVPQGTYTWSAQAGVLVTSLDQLELDDGDYELSLTVAGEVATQSTLRLRSGSTPDLASWQSCTRLVHDLDAGPWGMVSASPMVAAPGRWVDGPRAIGGGLEPARTGNPPSTPSWLTTPRTHNVPSRPVVLGHADPDSCLLTGKHYMKLPTWYGGRASGHIEGVCSGCNLVKRYPATPKAKKARGLAQPVTLDLGRLPGYEHGLVDNDTCLDALVHVGGGSLSSFERVATQADGSSLFVDDLLRTLEVLGHVDVRRDDRFQPVEWEVSPAQLAGLSDGSFLLTGRWAAASRKDFGADVVASGGRLHVLQGDGKVSSWVAAGLALESVDDLAARYDVAVAHDAAWRLLCALPALGALEATLAEVDVPSFTKAERFDVLSGSWLPTPGVVGPGAYRLAQSFRTICLWLDDEGARARRGRVGSVQLVKHLAARAKGKVLLAHLSTSETLVVPLGADLPGLYGRVAALCSGLPPIASPRTRSLAYLAVPHRVADGLAGLLNN